MAHSLEQSCTQLKLEYDSCFNSWFEGYLEPAVTASASPESRAKYSKEKADEYERKCGKIWASYRDCVRVCRIRHFIHCELYLTNAPESRERKGAGRAP
jgi:hypothetical protein